MQDRKEIDPKLVRGPITRSLHRSNVRKKIKE
jgi:predicted transcriptional regulator with HTH domain